MPEEDQRSVLRTGGWPPAYQAEVVRDSDRLPVPIPYRRPPLHLDNDPPHAGKVLLACAVVVVAGVGGMMAVLLPTDASVPPAPIAERMVFPTPPFPSATPVSLLPPSATNASFSPSPATSPVATRSSGAPSSRPATRLPVPPPAPSPSSGRPPTTAPTGSADLTVGRTVGLEVRGMPGYRVRHRNHVARIDRITAGSSPLDRADAGFVVRRGLAGTGCVSFESVNYPGYFLRHRDFTLRLDRRDRSTLFAQDATFCPSGGRDALTLRSLNYPRHSITADRSGTLQIADNRATTFRVRTPL